jgi:CHAT domain-containing protein
MKTVNHWLRLVLVLSLSVVTTPPIWAQEGNFSDITGPNNVDTGTTLQSEEFTGFGENSSSSGSARSSLEAAIQSADTLTAFELQQETTFLSFQQQLTGLVELSGRLPTPNEIARVLRQVYQATGLRPAYIQFSSQVNQTEGFVVFPEEAARVSWQSPDFSTGLLGINPAPKKSMASAHFEPDFNIKINLLALNKQITNPGLTPENLTPENSDFITRYTIPAATEILLSRSVKTFRDEVIDQTNTYKRTSKQLYDWLIAPINDQLQGKKIDVLIFSMDRGLRGLPVAALYDGEQFLIEKYGISVIPTFGLTDIDHNSLQGQATLFMGASTFKDQQPLPGVPLEIDSIQNIWGGSKLLDQDFTVENFVRQYESQEKKPSVIHMATHGEFKPGSPSQSYIQFADRRVSIPEFRQLAEGFGWNLAEQAPELLVLSACRTAVGDDSAELGFAGLAVESGAKSAVASLWYVSDLGTLALMTEFYEALRRTPSKAEALRQAQLSLIHKTTYLKGNQLILSDGRTINLPPELVDINQTDLSNPFYWSSFLLIGNWN